MGWAGGKLSGPRNLGFSIDSPLSVLTTDPYYPVFSIKNATLQNRKGKYKYIEGRKKDPGSKSVRSTCRKCEIHIYIYSAIFTSEKYQMSCQLANCQKWVFLVEISSMLIGVRGARKGLSIALNGWYLRFVDWPKCFITDTPTLV